MHYLSTVRFISDISLSLEAHGGRAAFSTLRPWPAVIGAKWSLSCPFLNEKRFPHQNLFFSERSPLQTLKGEQTERAHRPSFFLSDAGDSCSLRVWSNSATCHRGRALAVARKKRISVILCWQKTTVLCNICGSWFYGRDLRASLECVFISSPISQGVGVVLTGKVIPMIAIPRSRAAAAPQALSFP